VVPGTGGGHDDFIGLAAGVREKFGRRRDLIPHNTTKEGYMRALLLTALTISTSAFAGPPILHYVDGGTAGITRANFSVLSTTKDLNGRPSIPVPRPGTVFLLPLGASVFNEAPTDFELQPDGTVLVKTTGLYRATASVDWTAQGATDGNLRKVTIGRLPIGGSLGTKFEDGMLNIHAAAYDRIAVADIPGSMVPRYCAWSGNVAWPAIPAGAYGLTDIPLPCAMVGDMVQASMTQGADDVAITARVLADGTVRARLANSGANQYPSATVTLRVLASSPAPVAGENTDAWHTLSTPTVLLLAGERVFATYRSDSGGDTVQTTGQTYVQIEKWATVSPATARRAKR
jgi:hypothetical protein